MKNATKGEIKYDILQLLVLVLSVTTSAAVLWVPSHFGFGDAETDVTLELLPAFVFITVFAWLQWTRLFDFILRLFENKKH